MQTVPLEGISAVLGASLAVRGLFNIEVLLFGVYALLYHSAGYSMNSVEDWKRGHDKEDEAKSHHPLNAGTIDVTTADRFYKLLFAITAIYAISLSFISPNTIGSLAVIIIGVSFGVIYNLYGKLTVLKAVPISIAHSSVFVFPYVALGGDITSIVFLLSLSFVLIWYLFEISVSGEIKDIKQDEENFLLYLGANTGLAGVSFSSLVRQYAHGLNLLKISIVVFIISLAGTNKFLIAVIFLLSILLLLYTSRMLDDGAMNREQRIRQMSSIEMITAFLLTLSLSYIIGFTGTVLIIVGSTIWIVSFNLYLWNTIVGPKV